MPIGGEHEPVPPAPVDADAAIVRVTLVRQGDVGSRVAGEPEPGAGEQRVTGESKLCHSTREALAWSLTTMLPSPRSTAAAAQPPPRANTSG